MNWLLINTEGETVAKATDENKEQFLIAPGMQWLEIPVEIDPQFAKAELVEDVWTVVLNESDKTEADQFAFDMEREARFEACRWLIERHRDQVDASETPTLSSEQYQAWLAYRKALRDMPEVEGFDLANPNWPSEPGE